MLSISSGLVTVNVTEPKEVLNIRFLSHFPFLKTLFPSFFTTFASNSYIPPSLKMFFFTCVYKNALFNNVKEGSG